MMLSLRFTSLILAVLFLLHVLRNSLAHAHHAKVANSFDNAITGKNYAFEGKELVDANNHVANEAKKAVMGGRKMIKAHEVQQDVHIATKYLTPKLSGNEGSNRLKSLSMTSHYGSHNQMMMEKALQNPGSSKPRSVKLNKPVSEDQESRDRKDDSERLLKAAKEIMKLMRKDYGGKWKPKRKPPINNHSPMH